MTSQPPFGGTRSGGSRPLDEHPGAPYGDTFTEGSGHAPGVPPAYPPGSGTAPQDGPAARRPPSSGRRAAAVAGLVAVAVAGGGGGWLLAHAGSGSPARPATAATAPAVSAGPTAAASARPGAGASSTAKVPLADVTRIDPWTALGELRKAGLKATGAGVEAWSWTDTNGRNLLLATKTVDKREGAVVRAATLHVYHAAGLGQAPRMLLPPLRDPGTAGCDVDFGLDFVPGSTRVTDTDGDGYGEATVGWWSVCRGDPGPERIKLALLDEGHVLHPAGLRPARRRDPARGDHRAARHVQAERAREPVAVRELRGHDRPVRTAVPLASPGVAGGPVRGWPGTAGARGRAGTTRRGGGGVRRITPDDDVAVIGAGTMGAGIAEVAARAGHRVRLFDTRPRAGEQALAGLRRRLERDVARGRLDAGQAVDVGRPGERRGLRRGAGRLRPRGRGRGGGPRRQT